MEMRVSFSFPEGTPPDQIARKLRFHAGLLEGLPPKTAASSKNTDAETTTATKTKTRRAAPAVDETFDADDTDETTDTQEEFDLESADDVEASFSGDDDTDDEPAPVKKKKAKTITSAQVNDACKALAKAKGRPYVLKVLKKYFKTESVSELKPEQYAKALEVLAV